MVETASTRQLPYRGQSTLVAQRRFATARRVRLFVGITREPGHQLVEDVGTGYWRTELARGDPLSEVPGAGVIQVIRLFERDEGARVDEERQGVYSGRSCSTDPCVRPVEIG